MQGGTSSLTIVIAFVMAGGSLTLVRRIFSNHKRLPVNIPDNILRTRLRKLLNKPFVPFTIFLLVGGVFLPAQPWKRMTSTLLLDVVGGILSVIVPKAVGRLHTPSTSTLGSSPLGALMYNPADDPYYISNLESPVDPFIAEALDGVQFTNIVHIVLESVRADCYPFQEQSAFADYIKQTFPAAVNGTPITTSNVTPFIASLAEHTISWETMWSIVPFTHKALLGRNPS